MPKRDDLDRHPPVPCWFCGRKLAISKVVRDGIIRSREEERGGPQRVLLCPSCLRENLCEETVKGNWFASPNVTVGLLDVLFSQLPGAATEEVLQAISWYRDNEERRRTFFERDGDERYHRLGRSVLRMLWPWWSDAPRSSAERPRAGRAERPRSAGERAGGTRAGASGGRAGARGDGSTRGGRPREDAGARRPPPRKPPERPRLVTPHEVLGIPAQATADEIRRAFHRLAVQYHPDKVYHLGEEFQAMAHVKFQELKRAYDALMERR